MMPDITQLPLLANIFDVSADVLLGIDIKNKQKDIEKIIDNAKDYSGKGYFSKSEAILRAGLSRYPSSERLMAALIFAIGRYPYSFEGGTYDDDTYSQIQAEIICICEKLLAESTDDTIRSDAIYKLCTTYPKVGRREDAIKLAESNPGRYLASQDVLLSIYTGDKRFSHGQQYIKSLFLDALWIMRNNNGKLDNGSYPYTREEMIEVNKKVIAIIELIIEDGNYCFFAQRLAWTFLEIAAAYADMSERDNAILYLNKAKDMAIYSDINNAPDKKYTCLLFRGSETGETYHNITSNDSMNQLEEMKGKAYDFIRGDTEFIAIENDLKKYAGKH